MKRLTVMAAGLGWSCFEKRGRASLAGLNFQPQASVFPAVTCVAQASLRTGLSPAEHGMIANGWWSEALVKPLFWEQSARLVKGKRVWAATHAAGGSVGLFFFQQSLGESVDAIISPAPIHKHGGGMVMSCYTQPTEAAQNIEDALGRFPLHRYWGPLASPKVGFACLDWFERMIALRDVDEAYLYLPTLDYAAQKCGPFSAADDAAFALFTRQLERLADFCQRGAIDLRILGDYAIAPVTCAAVQPNVALRKAGLFKTRHVAGRAYPDFFASSAFALCDHEFCVVYGSARAAAVRQLLASGDYAACDDQPAHDGIVLLAKKGSWCDYAWWTDRREAPDYASHVDIHNKPGYDPRELFFFNRGEIRGTHGRSCEVAASV